MNPLPSAFNEAVFAHRNSVVSVEGRGNGFVVGFAHGKTLVMTAEHVVHDWLTTREVTVHVPLKGSVSGTIIFDDEAADLALIMVSDDGSVITGEALEFSDLAADVASENQMELVMLGYFSRGSGIFIEPGTSHGHTMKSMTKDNIQSIYGSYTGKPGVSGSPVFILHNGRPLVIGMICDSVTFKIPGTGDVPSRRAITAESIHAVLRDSYGAADGSSMPQMVPVIIQSSLPGGADV